MHNKFEKPYQIVPHVSIITVENKQTIYIYIYIYIYVCIYIYNYIYIYIYPKNKTLCQG